MASETDQLLRQNLAAQHELLAEYRKEAERTAEFRTEAFKSQKKLPRQIAVIFFVAVVDVAISNTVSRLFPQLFQ